MNKFDASNAECLVFTYKEGLLSKLAHDLKINVSEFALSADDQRAIDFRASASSLRVVCAMKDGSEDQAALSDGDKKKINEEILGGKVLSADKNPEILFKSSSIDEVADGLTINGTLTLNGTEKSVSILAKRSGDRWVAEFPLQQPDYSIKPFSAMMGTLKIKPEVTVRISLPA